jgi:hypothetical protein
MKRMHRLDLLLTVCIFGCGCAKPDQYQAGSGGGGRGPTHAQDGGTSGTARAGGAGVGTGGAIGEVPGVGGNGPTGQNGSPDADTASDGNKESSPPDSATPDSVVTDAASIRDTVLSPDENMVGGAGSIVWTRPLGSGFGFAVAASADSLYVAGSYQGTTDVAGQPITSAGMSDGFVAALEGDGNRRWVKTLGGVGRDELLTARLTTSGELIVGGYFSGRVDIFGTTLDSGIAELAGLLTSLDSSGRAVWVKPALGVDYVASLPGHPILAGARGAFTRHDGMGNTVPDSELRVPHNVFDGALDALGNVILVGGLAASGSVGGLPITTADSSDIYVAKINSEGKGVWAVSFAGTGLDYGRALAVDGNGDVFITGYFDGVLTIGTHRLAAQGRRDAFIGRLAAANGVVLWARSFGSPGEDMGYDITCDEGDVLIAGLNYGAVDFGGGSRQGNGFLVKLSGSSGQHLWSTRLERPTYGVTVAPNAIFVGGDGFVAKVVR